MAGPGVAIGTGVGAAPVRIEAPAEGEVRRIIFGKNGAGLIFINFKLGLASFIIVLMFLAIMQLIFISIFRSVRPTVNV